jgi:hypothetical protein
MKKLALSVLFATAIAAAAPASAAELVYNGSFESADLFSSGWSYTVSDTLFITTSGGAVHTGVSGLQFMAEAEYVADFVYQTLDTVVGETYHYSYWMGAATGFEDAPSSFQMSLGGILINNFGFTGNFPLTKVSGDYVATSTQTDIQFTGFNSYGLYVLDDVSVTGPLAGEIGPGGGSTHPIGGGGVPEPATWALMLMGFGGIGVAMRRRTAAGLAMAA